MLSLRMNPVQAEFQNDDRAYQSEGKEPEKSVDQIDHPVQPYQLGDGLQPVERQDVDDQNGDAKQEHLFVRDRSHD